MIGTFRPDESFNRKWERSMQAIVDKVMRIIAFRHPLSDEGGNPARQEATEFATELLQNYKSQLARRNFGAVRR
jgi:hypothetical protein